MDDVLGGRLIEQLGGRAEFALRLFDAAGLDRLDHLLALGADGPLGGAVPLAADEALFQSFLGTLDIRHGIRLFDESVCRRRRPVPPSGY